MTATDTVNPHAEILAAFRPGFEDFSTDLAAFFDVVRAWGAGNADRLRAADEARGYSDDIIGVIERDLFGQNLDWLQGLYFERGLHDSVAAHFIDRPFWDRDCRDLPWTRETGSNKRPASSDGVPLEELRAAFARFEEAGRGDLAVRIWLHVTDTMLGADGDPQDRFDTFDLCRAAVERCGAENDRARLAALEARLPPWPAEAIPAAAKPPGNGTNLIDR